jgi:hypothetical protein
MKKMIIIFMMFMAFLLTGCSAQNFSSKSENFVSEAEIFGQTIVEVKDSLKPLENKPTLTQKDQALIVSQIESLIEEMNDFKEAEAPLLAIAAKKIALKELNKREKELNSMKEKAKNGRAEVEDVEKILHLLSDDFKISMFEK